MKYKYKYEKATVEILNQGRQQGLTHKDLFETASLMILILAQIMKLSDRDLSDNFEDILNAFREPLPEGFLEFLYRHYLGEEEE